MRRELIGHYCCVITRQLLETGSEESVKGHGVRGVSPGTKQTGPAKLPVIWAFCLKVKKENRHLFQGTAPPSNAEFRETVNRYLWSPLGPDGTLQRELSLFYIYTLTVVVVGMTAVRDRHNGRVSLLSCRQERTGITLATRTENGVHVTTAITVTTSALGSSVTIVTRLRAG